MWTKPLLVIGIHQEELEFGKQITRCIKQRSIDVLRIPKGIPQNKNPSEAFFYHQLRHREIYMQLRQQTIGRYNLLLDLHSGINEPGRCADIYCRDESLLSRLNKEIQSHHKLPDIRTVHIAAENERMTPNAKPSIADQGQISHAMAHTLIPVEVWNSREFLYIGLEVYITETGEGAEEDWFFTCTLVDLILRCAETEKTDGPWEPAPGSIEKSQS